MKPLPIGIQTFSEIVNHDMVYIDKTDLIYQLVKPQKYFFLSRPRRFGKSLLISTLQAYFEGKKELFKDLKIEQLETEWTEYPVINLSFAKCKSDRLEEIVKFVSKTLSEQEYKLGIVGEVENLTEDQKPNISFNDRLQRIIETANAKTGRPVVLLIDEYDALMLNTITDRETQKAVRVHMNNLFSPIKDLDPILKFVFITGITKFSQMSIFSTLNNLTDISLYEKYCTLCGFTEKEIRTTLKSHVEALADKLNCSFNEAIAKLKVRYDGYKFSDGETGVFNPYSVLRALDSMKLENYWFKTATPSALIELLKENSDLQIAELENIMLDSQYFDTPVERVSDIIPLLYQSGYLTIKSYDPEFDQYVIGFPNTEVRTGFSETLMKRYAVSDKGIEKSAEEAFKQIDEKEYEKKFSFEGKHVWKIGVNFSSEKRTVDEWKIEE